MENKDIQKILHELAGSFATIKMIAAKLLNENGENENVVRWANLIFKIGESNLERIKQRENHMWKGEIESKR